ncbi:RimK-like ATPgrasp N-terminal domain-containing protein [Methanoregula sp.]|uniref:RimK-like ATPgrasp N-terminal domain-containing protein n=1 Tax=Methanoregula sp. TaxID=2052170 RepID=UPI0026079466|nr:RimK-like ATPgrasp N-terminal domain-containing protein [Methanoregula sp.]
MNSRFNGSHRGEAASVPPVPGSCVPLIRPDTLLPPATAAESPVPPARHPARGTAARKEPSLSHDALYTVWRDHVLHIVSANYSYKTEPYYTILRHELEGTAVLPSSASVIDAYVVPVCLERALLAGIPVCEWGISQAYTPLPAILYGLNYYATAAEYAVVCDTKKAKEFVKHITNRGKYPFCYQKLAEDAEIGSCTAIFGRTAGRCSHVTGLARQVYDLFHIPLVTIVYIRSGEQYLLSSISPVKNSHLSREERTILSAYLSQQEFL